MKILAVDDEPSARLLMKVSLKKWGYEPIMAASCEEALEFHKNENLNFVISDWIMPGKLQGIDLINIIRSETSYEKGEYTYIILLTAKNEQKDVFEGIRAGADDYIKKPFDPKELRTRIQLGRRILSLKEANIDLVNQISIAKEESYRDCITKLYNRRIIIKKIQNELNKNKKPLSILTLSVEKLRIIGYTYSFKTAEKVACEIAKRLKHSCSPDSFIGRFSDTEFIIVTPGAEERDTYFLADILKNSIENKTFVIDKKISINLKTIIGFSFSKSDVHETPHKLITKALYPIIATSQKRLA